MTQEDFECKLSFVSLNDDNLTMLLNGESKFSAVLPVSISKKNSTERKTIAETCILDACNNHGIDYVSEDNIKNRAKEIVDQLYERARVSKNYVAPPAHETISSSQYGNDYFEYLVNCVKMTVKEESALIRQIVYTLLSAYGNDPINLGVLAPTSTGKTYPIMECVKFTPGGKEVRIVGSMTPKVLVREQGVLVDKNGKPIGKDVRRLRNAITQARAKKNFDAVNEYQDELAVLAEDSAYILDMSGKTLIFLEPPHPELWDLLKPILSHDNWEIEHPFVDKLMNGMEVKRVITRGWPACIFCSAKDESKWDVWPEVESRFMMASPNMIKPKYLAGNKLIGQKKGLPHGVKQQLIISDTSKALGKQSFLYLKHQIQQYTSTTDSPVWIPFVERIAEILPSDRGQDNRAANRFFTMLNIIALSKAHLRHKLLFDDEELVIATLDDLREALHVMQNITGMPPHKLKFYQQYILPLYKDQGSKLETKQICNFYNANNTIKGQLMNSDNLRKNYLQELVNHNYLEQEQDENTKAAKYLYTPLVDTDEKEEEQQQTQQPQPQQQPPTSPTLGRVVNYLQYSRLLLPENHTGIPLNWLNDEFLQLSNYRLTDRPLKILDPKGNDVSIDVFSRLYEPSETGLKIQDFYKAPRLVGSSNSREFTTSGGQSGRIGAIITLKYDLKGNKSTTIPKVGQVGDFEAMIKEVMDGKGYFTMQEWQTKLMFLPVQDPCRCNQDEAEQTLYALLQEGKLEEIEQGRYRPTT